MVALVVVLAPMGSASLLHPAILKAPYKHLLVATFSNTGQVACGKDRVTAAPHFSPKTGTGGFSDTASDAACAGLPTNIANRGLAASQVSVVLPVKLFKSHVHIKVNWTFTAALSEKFTPGACKVSTNTTYGCTEVAQAFLAGVAYLYDTYNGSVYSSSNFWIGFQNISENSTTCSSGSCSTATLGGATGSFSGSQNIVWYVNATALNTSQSFILEIDLFGQAYAEMDAYNTYITGGSAQASLNFATLGNGATLNSITIA